MLDGLEIEAGERQIPEYRGGVCPLGWAVAQPNLSSDITDLLSGIMKCRKQVQLPVRKPQLKHAFSRPLAGGTMVI